MRTGPRTDASRPAGVAAAGEGPGGREPVNVLLVDDRRENLLALEAVLEPLGENLVLASSGEEALGHLLADDFAAILLDVQMPGMDGFETARLIRQRHRTRQTPIVFLTAISREERNIFEGYEAGAVDYIVKPFEPLVLRSKVRAFAEMFRQRRTLQQSEERFRRSFDDAPLGMALIATDGRWLRVNRCLCELTGYEREELLRSSVHELTPYARELEADLAEMRRLIAGETPSYQLERRYIRADGKVVWVLLNVSLVRDPDGLPLHFLAQIEDITERKQAEQEAGEASLRDPLTGLASRTLLIDRIELALARLRRRTTHIAMFLLDLDRFDRINDSFGHRAGDRLLAEVAERLRRVTRESDTVARLAGDRFVVLSEDHESEHAAIPTVERLRAAIRQPFEVDGAEAFVTASTGIAITRNATADPEGLLADAQAAMHRAKERGQDHYDIFDEAMRARARERLSTEAALGRAVERGELRLVYQPVVRLSDGAVTGMEALLRWHHHERGVVGPADFVPLAEDNGLILPIGRWVLDTACGAAVRWHGQGHELTVAVNVSAVQLAHPELEDIVASALSRSGLEPNHVCLEVTESVLMGDAAAMIRVLERLRALGVHLAVDDFGTGYSSLSYLHRFPVDVLKIDRSFVSGLGHDDHSPAIVKAIVAMAHALRLTTVAEGVETTAQLAALRELGAASAQGFLLAPPRDADKALEPIELPTLGMNGAAGAVRAHSR